MRFLEQGIYDLLNQEPFFANVILQCKIYFDKFKVPTAGASFLHGRPVLIFNTEFMNSLSRKETVAVLKHEVLHLIFDHLDRRQYRDPKLFNFATDCAINQHIENLPENAITLEGIQALVNGQATSQATKSGGSVTSVQAQTDTSKHKIILERFETAEYYYEHLMSVFDAAQESGLEPLDDHDIDFGDEAGGEVIDANARKAIAGEMAAKAISQSAGKIPQSLAKGLNGLNAEPKVNWRQILRNFVASSTASSTQGTRKKPHRRFGLDQPGRKKKRELVIGVCLDESGSVSDDQLQMFWTEIPHILKNSSKLLLVHADSEVAKVEHIRNQKDLKPERAAGGGTAYQPAITACVQQKCDAIIYLGDMDTADTPSDPGIPVLWVTVGSENKPGNFGSMVKLA